ncbi:hypothetical protein AB0M20_19355 [Actinoplanes sp. NPDC051633]
MSLLRRRISSLERSTAGCRR